MEEVEKKHPIKSEDALYRAVLRIILFKHIVAEKLIGEFAQSPSTSKDKCTFNLGSVNGSLIELGRLLVDTFTDVGIANKKQAKNMRASSENVANTISNLTLATTSLIVIDETSNLFLKQTVIQHSFGKLIKCGGD